MSDNAIYKWLAGRGQPSLMSALAIARAAGVSLEWLATGAEPAAGGRRAQPASDYALMPRGEVRLGPGRGARLASPVIVDVLSFAIDWLRRRLCAEPGRLMLLEVRGDSMAPTLVNGDLVLGDLRVVRAGADGIYILRECDDLVVKRIQRNRRGARLMIRCDNPAYAQIEAAAAAVKVVGRVIWMGRAF